MKARGAMVVALAALALTACRAEIRGTVVARAEALPGATVTLLGSGLPEPRRVVTDELGRYSFPSLKPGRYTVQTSLSGFDAPNHELILTPGSVANLELTMLRRPQRAVFDIVDSHGGTGAVADEVGIRALVTRYEDATQKRDPKLLEVLFTADADQLLATGEWFRGRERIIAAVLASPIPRFRHIAIEDIRFVTPDVAILNGRFEIAVPTAMPRRRRMTLMIVRGAANEWRIASIRNMEPTDPSR